jgi:hypothetical protein
MDRLGPAAGHAVGRGSGVHGAGGEAQRGFGVGERAVRHHYSDLPGAPRSSPARPAGVSTRLDGGWLLRRHGARSLGRSRSRPARCAGGRAPSHHIDAGSMRRASRRSTDRAAPRPRRGAGTAAARPRRRVAARARLRAVRARSGSGGLRAGGRGLPRGAPRRRPELRHRRPDDRVARLGGRTRRRGHHDPVLVLRDERDGPAAGRRAGVRRPVARRLPARPERGRRGGDRAHAGDPPGPPVRRAGADGRVEPDRAAPRTARPGGCGAGLRRPRQRLRLCLRTDSRRSCCRRR